MSCTLTVRGFAPEAMAAAVKRAIQPTVGDMLTAGQIIRANIRERTAQGLDLSGAAFAPYSTKGPYYYNPGTRGGKFRSSGAAHEKRAARNMVRSLGGNGTLSRTGRSIKFDSYAAFKAAFGRAAVDLMGIQAPHMLDAIVVRVGSTELAAAAADVGAMDGMGPADTVTIGIYDSDAVGRARGHNRGTRTLPQREFLGISEADARMALQAIGARIDARLRALQAESGGMLPPVELVAA
jgi:hypothetical protein